MGCQNSKIKPPIIQKNLSEHKIQVILVGDTSVGKTTILQTIHNKSVILNNQVPLLGIDLIIQSLEIDHETYKIIYWDTAGQERYNSITTNYVRQADLAVLMFDLSNIESFKNAIEKWLKFVQNHSIKDIPIILCGNKKDLIRRDDPRKINKFIEEYDIEYVETSKYDIPSVDMLNKMILSKAIMNHLINTPQSCGIKIIDYTNRRKIMVKIKTYSSQEPCVEINKKDGIIDLHYTSDDRKMDLRVFRQSLVKLIAPTKDFDYDSIDWHFNSQDHILTFYLSKWENVPLNN